MSSRSGAAYWRSLRRRAESLSSAASSPSRLPGGGEQRRVPGQHRLVADVARAHRLAHAVGADQHDVAGVLDELQRHQLLDGAAVDALGPGPVEVGQRLEAPDVGLAQPALQAAAAALGGLPGQHLRHPARLLGLRHHLGPVGQQAVQAKCGGLLAQRGRCGGVSHRGSPVGPGAIGLLVGLLSGWRSGWRS